MIDKNEGQHEYIAIQAIYYVNQESTFSAECTSGNLRILHLKCTFFITGYIGANN